MSKWEKMKDIAQGDLEALRIAEESYGDSWDIFEAGEVYEGEDGILDDIRDLRRYLILVENEILNNQNNNMSEQDEEDDL